MKNRKPVSGHNPASTEFAELHKLGYQQLMIAKAELQGMQHAPINFIEMMKNAAAMSGGQDAAQSLHEPVTQDSKPAAISADLPRRLSREQTMKMLNVGKGSIYKLEALGKLTPRKLTGLPNSRVAYDRDEVERLLKPD